MVLHKRKGLELLARHGALVVAATRRIERIERLVGEIKDSGGTATAVQCDICDDESGCVFQEIPNCAVPCAGPGAVCEDGNKCNKGTCIKNPDVDSNYPYICTFEDITSTCIDNNPCTKDSCAPASGCTTTPVTASCDDGNPCTKDDVCGDDNVCSGTEKECPGLGDQTGTSNSC